MGGFRLPTPTSKIGPGFRSVGRIEPGGLGGAAWISDRHTIGEYQFFSGGVDRHPRTALWGAVDGVFLATFHISIFQASSSSIST